MIIGILQARFSSTRLPGKVLKEILGIPMLQLQLERLQRVKRIDLLVVATSNDSSDDPIEDLCKNLNIACFRGSLNHVLDRYYHAAVQYKAKHIVRLTGDCPLTDPDLIDQVIQYYLDESYDYASNTIEPTFPDGLDVEIFRFSALADAWKEASLASEHEHVSSFIYKSPDRYRIGSYKGKHNLSNLRWTVDEPEDFDFVRKVYKAAYPKNSRFTTDDILDLINRQPDLKKINSGLTRNEGYQKSLKKDK
jgi:spore coat polysaccharide biosynthesis protein SpsF (cytidylyltransferase family)